MRSKLNLKLKLYFFGSRLIVGRGKFSLYVAVPSKNNSDSPGNKEDPSHGLNCSPSNSKILYF